MQLRTAARSSPPGGFSLIELMVVVAIATILFAVAVPSYLTYIRQSRRTEARTAVLDLAGREERFFSTSGAAYSVTPAQLGYAALPVVIGGGYYQLAVCSPAANCDPNANVPAAPSYYVTATAVGGQTRDLQCFSFSVDSTGRQFAVDSTGADATQFCWAN
jgi:type IV pilus assembly protein PilE